MIPIATIVTRLRSSGLVPALTSEIDLEISGITDDSREVKPGDLYCAIRGFVHDGHTFLKEAAEAGAVASLVESEQAELDLPQIRVTNTRRAASIAAQAVYGDPAERIQLVGVTGTNGKTTTVQLTRHLLNGVRPTGSIGTLGVTGPMDASVATALTTPGPVEFARYLADLERDGAEVVVSEVSSHALAQDRVSGATFDAAVFTNLSRDHLDYHIDFEDYRAAKASLAELVTADGILVVNADEPAWADLPATHRRVTYGISAAADYSANELKLLPTGTNWRLAGPAGQAKVQLPLLGEFNVANALAAAATACALGMDLEAVAEALSVAPSIPGRLEILASEPLVLRDYAHTPDALRRALAALRPLVSGRLIVLFGCGGDRDAGKREMMGMAAAEGADYSIVTSDNPRTESPDAIIAAILPGLGDAAHEVNSDRRAAIARALDIAGPGDAVLLAGKGHEIYQVVGDERRPFDEAEIVEGLLSGRG